MQEITGFGTKKGAKTSYFLHETIVLSRNVQNDCDFEHFWHCVCKRLLKMIVILDIFGIVFVSVC